MLYIVILTLINYLTFIYLELFLLFLIRILLNIIVKFSISSLELRRFIIVKTKSFIRRIAFYYLLKL